MIDAMDRNERTIDSSNASPNMASARQLTPSACLDSKKKVVFLSAVHDFRMLKRGSIQSLASAMAKMGYAVTFISLRFSLLSLIKGDSRNFLLRRSNRPELVNGVLCYLWFTVVHPFQSKNKLFESLLRPHYFFHKRRKSRFLDDQLRGADFIVIESGQGILFSERARRLNPQARIIYRASDKLSTIGASNTLQSELEKNAEKFDWICLLSADMASEFAWAREKTFCVPLGIDADEFKDNGPNPYSASINAVSVGSMLFDRSFFETAATRFPDIQFHVIGCGGDFEAPPNVTFYDEMAFKDTLRYIEYASFGIAPYRAVEDASYLATSSLKLKQYEYFGIPAVCPAFAVGNSRNRFGYIPADKTSIERAIGAALKCEFVPAAKPLEWRELAQRLLCPHHYPDCFLPDLRETRSADLRNELSTANAPAVTISLILCTLGNRKRQLTRLIRSLADQTFKAFEVVLVDQNPPGYLDEILKTECSGLVLRHVRSDPGLSIARNAGLLAATGGIVGFPDDDCWYFPDTLMQVVSFFCQNPTIDILLGRTVDEFDQPSLNPLRMESGTVTRSNIWISGNSNTLFVSKDAIPSTGAFDEKIGVGAPSRYQSGEETDFILRLMKNKARPVYVNYLKIGHDQVQNAGARKELKRAWMYSLGFGYVLKKQEYGFMYCCYRIGRSIISAVWAAARLRFVYGLSRLVWATGTLIGYLTAKHSREGI
ncbi:glycosyltransferase [Bradyrhizobium sp. 76]|uniref:GumK N-terminal domain-containing glycosyltransferase n=1 Tax=Bradyrhizobium sp. 76 TaxID=2782680 RepID=UPI001FF79182|nr:glycosyltransferase [Bradyrhizobium sp. 76]MCK1404947.1 glycosyltransferase [Bradyrhizobium sp. 76]